MVKTYKVVKGGSSSTEYSPRWIIVDPDTGEVLDDAQGYGYKSIQKAHAGYGYKTRDRSKDAEKAAKAKRIAVWCKANRKFVQEMEQLAFEIEGKQSWGPDVRFNAAFVKRKLDESGHTDLTFTAGDLLRYWHRNGFCVSYTESVRSV